MRPLIVTLLSCMVAGSPGTAFAQETFKLVIENHAFTPTSLSVPANVRFRIEVENRDPTPAEFESSDLRVEKIVVGGGKISVFVGPLKPGTYAFFDDYHPDTAKGTMIAKAP
jgi:hypothetical protein